MKDWLLLFLRLAAGVGLAYWAGHGKVFEEDTREAYATLLRDGGIPASYFMTLLFGVVEFFGSMFLVVGLYTRKAAGLMLVVVGAAAAIHQLLLDAPVAELFRVDQAQGMGFGFFLVAYLLLIIVGPGNLSFDAGRRKAAAE
jgi:uncharacterized membrane protein YphA (DoxX/SURF4 family)